MFEDLFYHIELKVPLTLEDKNLMKTFFTSKSLLKKQYLLEQGEHCKFMTFVSKGLLKSYNLDEKGNEHINLFAWEGWWVSDMISFFSGTSANLNIDAIEDSELLIITLSNYNKLLAEAPVMERYFRILYQNSLLTKEQRLLSSSTETAEQRYKSLIKSQPDLVKRIPQNLLASYLGLVPETISRIKKRQNNAS